MDNKAPELINSSDYGDTYTHDAYGMVTLSTSNGDGQTLFGSYLKHSRSVRITVKRAFLNRNHGRDRVSEKEVIVDFMMSRAQFAQLITSNGDGAGTPVTLRRAPEPGMKTSGMPEINNPETKNDTHRREIRGSSTAQIADINESIDQLGQMIESGKLSKAELRKLQFSLKCKVGNLPSNMEDVVKQAEVALDKATSDAKIEVEACISDAMWRVGSAVLSSTKPPHG